MNDLEQPTQDRRTSDVSAFEKHAQTIIAAVITALVIGVGSLVYSARNETANLSIEFRYMAAQISKLEEKLDRMNNSYATKVEVKELEVRVRDVERKVK